MRRAGAGAGGGKVMLVGFAREKAVNGAMHSVPEEDGDTSITIGTGSKAPFSISAAGSAGSADSVASGAHSGGREGGGTGAPRRAVGGLVSFAKAAPGPARAATGGDSGEFTPPLDSEQTDTASCSSGGGRGGGECGQDASATSGLLGGGSTSGSALALESNGKPGKVRRACGESETPGGYLIRFHEFCLSVVWPSPLRLSSSYSTFPFFL